MYDELFEIADDSSNDYIETEGGQRLNSEHVNRSRLRIDTRKWVMERMAPKKYMPQSKVDHTSSDGSMATVFDEEKYKKAQSNLEGLD